MQGASGLVEIKLSGNYIHDPASEARDSYSGTQLRGAQGVTISCSNYALGAYGRAAILMEDVNGGTSRVTVARNWLDGGGFTVVANAKGVALRSNTFGRSAKNGICQATSGHSIHQSRNRTSDGAQRAALSFLGRGPSQHRLAHGHAHQSCSDGDHIGANCHVETNNLGCGPDAENYHLSANPQSNHYRARCASVRDSVRHLPAEPDDLFGQGHTDDRHDGSSQLKLFIQALRGHNWGVGEPYQQLCPRSQ